MRLAPPAFLSGAAVALVTLGTWSGALLGALALLTAFIAARMTLACRVLERENDTLKTRIAAAERRTS